MVVLLLPVLLRFELAWNFRLVGWCALVADGEVDDDATGGKVELYIAAFFPPQDGARV